MAALSSDTQVAQKNGGIYTARSLAEEYGSTDIDGRCPDYAVLESAVAQAKKTYLAPLMDAVRFAKVDWKLVPKADTPS